MKFVRIPKNKSALPCSGPGVRRHAAFHRKEVLLRDQFTCQKCKRELPEYALEADHIIPLSQGGPDNMMNMQTLCIECHRRKTELEKTDGR